jgi:putative ABC transport system permease protein
VKSRLVGVFERIVGLYPESFRACFASDVVEHFRRGCERRKGARLLAFALRTYIEVAAAALLERAERARASSPSRGRTREPMIGWMQDLRYAFRTLRKMPTFASIAIATLALGITVNTTIFSVVSSLLFADLPVRDPERFVFLWATNERATENRSALSLPEVADLRERAESFEAISLAIEDPVIVIDRGESQRLDSFRVTDNFFDVWGVTTVLGRGFEAGEDRPGAAPLAVLSHGYWKRGLGSDPGVVGATLSIDGKAHTIVGVLSPRMEIGDVSRIDVWLPLGIDLRTAPRDERVAFTQARVTEDSSPARAQEECSTIAAALAREYPESEGWGFRVSPLSEELLSEEDRALLIVISICVAFVLLIACVNVANMLMARASSRSREIAVRLALGVSRGRLVRQLLVEGFLLSVGAAVVGLVVARGLLNVLVFITAGKMWIYQAAEIDSRTLVFTLAVAFVTPLLFALAPSLRATRPDLSGSLKEGARSGSDRVTLRSRGWLVTAQVAMALTLMVVTGLLVRSLIELKTADLGFDPMPVLAVSIELDSSEYDSDERIRRFFEALVERANATPGVSGAALVSPLPFSPAGQRRNLHVEGHSVPLEEETPSAYFFTVSPGYFSTMTTPLRRGRDFSSSDDPGGAPVAIINEEAGRRFFAGADPLGRRLRLASARPDAPALEIVGVVSDVAHLDDRMPTVPQVYVPFSQSPSKTMSVVVRASGDPALLADPMRNHVESLDPKQGVEDIRTMDDLRAEVFSSADAVIALFVIFAAFALAMASMGIYGVMSYSVSQREREIGIRIALGADHSELMKMIAREGAKLVVLGSGIGLAGALLVGRMLSGVVFGVSVTDPATYVSVTLLLGLVALVANWVPARRATRVDPIATLRTE